ncbi:Leucine-rich repeats and immunoglobulin-like domains protein 2, partial [Orchesella cincta]
MLVFIRHLILNSSVLEGLHCQLPSRRHEMFGIMEAGRPDVFQKLKSLSSISLNQEEMEMLSNNGINKLRSLSFTLYSGFRVPTIHPLLSSLGQTLESLEIDFVTLPRVPEPFPSGIDLVHIKHLTLKKFYGSIHFVSHMANIETLCLEDANLSVAFHDEASKFQYRSGLKSLKIFGGRGSTGRFLFPALYHEIVRFFPRLTKLRMEYFTDSTIKIIVEGLPDLEELDIPNGIYSDVILTGADDRNENAIEPNTQKCAEVLEKAECLADLKRLRKLVLQSPKITDIGVRHGLLSCFELRSLSVDTPM